MTGTVQGSPDGPRYIYGKKNVNYQGARRASGNAISGSESSVRSDFSSVDPYDFEEEKVSIEDADLDTPLKDIDFEDYEDSGFGEPYLVDSDIGQNVYIQSYGDDVTMTYEFEDNARNTILSLLDGDVYEAEELEYDPYGSDEDAVSDEYYDAYSEALQSFADKEGLSLDQEFIEADYGRLSFHHSVDITEEDPEYNLGNLHDNFNGAYNAFTYRLPDSFRSDFEHALKEKGISTHDLADKVEAIRLQAEEDDDED